MSRWLFVLLCAPALFAQSNTGELREFAARLLNLM